MSLPFHQFGALTAQLQTGGRMDGVVDAAVAGNKASQQRCVFLWPAA